MKKWNLVEEGEMHVLLDHCIERLPKLKEGMVEDFMDENRVTISFESPKFIITMKLERKKKGAK